MALSSMDLQNSSISPNSNHLFGEIYKVSLHQSIQSLLESLSNKPLSESSSFTATFFKLLQSRADAPLETIWIYSALTSRSKIDSAEDEPLNRLSAARDLFQLISACSASCGSSKSVALVAPVLYQVYRLIVDLRTKEFGSKKLEKLNREIKSLVNVILGHISVCCSKDWINEDCSDSDTDGLIRPLEDLVRVWIGEEEQEDSMANNGLNVFFPLVSNEIIQRLSNGGCEVSELAGVVITEAFLLRLCLDFHPGKARAELQKEWRAWAVGSITGFGNICFFGILARMLLEPTLPVTSLLSAEDENVLRKVLYDTVILVDYKFLHPGRLDHLPAQRINGLSVARLIVTHEATGLFRKEGDQSKAISYINAFSSSHLPRQIIKWVTSEIGIDAKASGPKGSSPQAFLRWLIDLENQGMKLFDDSTSKFRSKLVLYEDLAYKSKENKSDSDLMFFIDNKGEEEDGSKDDEETNDESMNDAFVAAAQTMKSGGSGIDRKRKERKSKEKKKRVKFLKHNLQDESASSAKLTRKSKDGSSSNSEVENPLSDENSE